MVNPFSLLRRGLVSRSRRVSGDLTRSVALLVISICLVLLPSTQSAAQGIRRITTRDLVTLVDIEGLAVSPNERWAAFQTRRADPEANTYEQAWYVIDLAGGRAPTRIGDGGHAMPTVMATEWIYTHGFVRTPNPVWSPDSQWIIYRRQDGDRIQLWRSHLGGRSEQLTHNEGDVHTGYERGADNRVAFSENGRRIFFTTRLSQREINAALASEGRSGFLFDDRFLPAKGSRPMAPRSAALTSLWVFDLDRQLERRASDAETVEHRNLFAPPRTPERDVPVNGQAIASPSGSIAWLEARDPERQGLYPPLTLAVRMSGDQETLVCDKPACTEQGITLEGWRGDDEVLFTRRPPGRRFERSLYAWRPREEAPPREVLRTRGVYQDCGMAAERLVCLFEDMDRPRRLVAIDLERGVIETLYDPNPQWSRFDLGAPPRLIPFQLTSGPEGYSYLVLPPGYDGGERLPLVINAYACDDFQDMRGAVGDEYPVFAFAAHGFAVLCHNIGSLDWSVAAREAMGGIPAQFGSDDAFMQRIQDGLDVVVAQLVQQRIVDPERVGITGLSLGGQTVEYALIHMRLAAAISSGSHFVTSAPYVAYPRGRREFWQAGFDSSASPRFNTRSISRNADRISAALLMNVSDAEFEVETIVSLQMAGRAAEMFVFPGEFHIKNQPAHRLAIYNRNVDWMNFWLRGVEGGLSGDGEQYTRWRAMRENQCRVISRANAPWYCRGGRVNARVGTIEAGVPAPRS